MILFGQVLLPVHAVMQHSAYVKTVVSGHAEEQKVPWLRYAPRGLGNMIPTVEEVVGHRARGEFGVHQMEWSSNVLRGNATRTPCPTCDGDPKEAHPGCRFGNDAAGTYFVCQFIDIKVRIEIGIECVIQGES